VCGETGGQTVSCVWTEGWTDVELCVERGLERRRVVCGERDGQTVSCVWREGWTDGELCVERGLDRRRDKTEPRVAFHNFVNVRKVLSSYLKENTVSLIYIYNINQLMKIIQNVIQGM